MAEGEAGRSIQAGVEQPPAESSAIVDFVLDVYRGCCLPEDYTPARRISWVEFRKENVEMYTAAQFDQIAMRLMGGKSWVLFDSKLETICAPEHYKKAGQR